jgi:glycosyltransferase involved in cell wall biosynthesis
MLLSNPFRPDPRVLKEALALAGRGHRLSIICWDRQAEHPARASLAGGAIEIFRVNSVPSSYGIGAAQLLRLPRFWLKALALLDELQPDILHCHDFDTLPAGLLWGKPRRRPVIYDAHEYYADLCRPRLPGLPGRLLYQAIRLGERMGAHLADAVVTVDQTLAAFYRRNNRRVLILGHTPPRLTAEIPSSALTRPELRLLYSGRLSVDRGLLTYAEILRGLLAAGLPAKLVLAGVFTPAAEETRFRERLSGIEQAVEYLGWVDYDQIPALTRQADIGLALLLPEPRYIAALPVKLFEYMAAGLPILASDFPPIQAVFRQAQFGELVHPAAGPARAVEIIKTWWADPSAARALGENGRRAILERYNWENEIDPLHQLYRQSGENRPAA